MEQRTPGRSRRRTLVRVAVPVAVAAVVATGVGLVPALASDKAPDLPQVSAEQLVAKVMAADTDTFSGTLKVKADLGLPGNLQSLAGGGLPGGLASGLAGGLAGGDGKAHSDSGVGGGGTGVVPEGKVLELLGGEHTLKLAADGPDRQRAELSGAGSGYLLVHNGDQVWAYDAKKSEAMHLTGVPGAAAGERHRAPAGVPTPQQLAGDFLKASAATTSVTVDGTEEVAGRPAYRLSVKPRQQGSTIAEIRISVDSATGTPLAFLVRNVDGDRVLDVHFSSVSFDRPAAKTFEFSAPKGAKVTEQRADAKPDGKAGAAKSPFEHGDLAGGDAKAGDGKAGDGKAGDGPKVVGEGWTAVAALGSTGGGQQAAGLAKMFGKPVGGGTLVSTKVVNVLVTDDGRVFAGAVTLPVLKSAAGLK